MGLPEGGVSGCDDGPYRRKYAGGVLRADIKQPVFGVTTKWEMFASGRSS